MMVGYALILAATTATVTAAPYGWESSPAQQLNDDDAVTVYVMVKHGHASAESLHATFDAVSDPQSPEYGRHLTRAELAESVKPCRKAHAAVTAWLRNASLPFAAVGTGSGDVLRVTAPAQKIMDLLSVKINRYSHSHAGVRSTILRTEDDIVLPESIEDHVDYVHGISAFPNPVGFMPKPVVAAAAGGPKTVNPSKIKSVYHIGNTVFSKNTRASQALAEFQDQGSLPKNLAKFESMFGLPDQPIRNATGNAIKVSGVEAELDVQYIIAAATGVPTDMTLGAGNSFDLLGWVQGVLANPNSALVWSVSYGEGINGGIGGKIQPSVASRLDDEFKKLGVLGHTVFVASGDSGVYDREPFSVEKFHPSYPACLPSVTAVGGTELDESGDADGSGWSNSGGGFTPSEYFTRAANSTWQAKAVQDYLSSGVKLPAAHLWDRNGRGLPDVSAVSVGYEVVTVGGVQPVAGTSASTPTVAGIFSLVNDARLAAGKSPLGFANPFIYQNAQAFRDVTKGENNANKLFLPGFQATKGWDPVTGLGAPLLDELVKAALSI